MGPLLQGAGGGGDVEVGKSAQFPIGTDPAILANYIRAGAAYPIADHPLLATVFAAMSLPAANFEKVLDVDNPSAQLAYVSTIVFHAGRWWTIGSGNINSNKNIYSSVDQRNWTIGNTITGSSTYLGVDSAVLGSNAYLTATFASTGIRIFRISDVGVVTDLGNLSTVTLPSGHTRRLKPGGGKLWFVGGTVNAGLIVSSPDGVALTVHASAIATTVNDIAFQDDLRGIAVHDGGRVQTTDDGGTTWTERTTGVTESLSAVLWDADIQQYVIFGSKGRMLMTGDRLIFTKGIVSHAITTPRRVIKSGSTIALTSSSSALDGRGRILISNDYSNWSNRRVDNSDLPTDVNDIAADGEGRFAAIVSSSTAPYKNGLVATAAPAFDPATHFWIPPLPATNLLYETWIRAR